MTRYHVTMYLCSSSKCYEHFGNVELEKTKIWGWVEGFSRSSIIHHVMLRLCRWNFFELLLEIIGFNLMRSRIWWFMGCFGDFLWIFYNFNKKITFWGNIWWSVSFFVGYIKFLLMVNSPWLKQFLKIFRLCNSKFKFVGNLCFIFKWTLFCLSKK